MRQVAASPCRRCDPIRPCDRCGASSSEREIELAPDPASVRKARDFVRTQLRDLGFLESVDDGILVVSELASNAIASAPETPYSVTVRVGAGHPVIEVHDCSPDLPKKGEPDFMSERGRGLHVVDELCAGWDCVPSSCGKAVVVALPRTTKRDRLLSVVRNRSRRTR
jgi:anti-sigma regulatory factor (Ser/Thr protein kinase)